MKCISKFNYKLSRLTVLFIVVISVGWGITKKVVTQIKHSCCCPLSYIIVTGKRQYTTNDKINQLVINSGALGTFITQDISIIQKQIEQFPWIQQVSIRKQWPDTLKINIVEHVPLAYWNESRIISASGIVFNIPESYVNNNNLNYCMPILYGPEGSEQDVLINYHVFNAILKFSECKIKSVKMDIRRSWQLTLQNNIHLKLGNRGIIERLYCFVKIYPVLLYKSKEYNKYIDYIDFRYYSGFAIKWVPYSIKPHIL